MHKRSITGIVTSLAISGCVIASVQHESSQVTGSQGAENDLIVFASERDGNREVYTMRPDGSDMRRLTPMAGPQRFSFGPRWSPERTRIAFYSNRDATTEEARDEDFEIYVMGADGSNPRRLTHNSVMDRDPAWSPDGRKIAFASARDGHLQLHVMDSDGTNVRRLTYSDAVDREPDWSADGRQIAFSSTRDGTREVYVVDADGSSRHRLTYHESLSGGSAWSPDGSQIAHYLIEPERQEMHVIQSDGTNARRLADHPGTRSRWSRTGNQVVFQYNNPEAMRPDIGGSGWEIYVMNSDGTNIRRLTDNHVFDAYADW